MKRLEEFTVRMADGRETTLAPYEGRVLLVVNTASRCGFTPQYEGLEKLQRTFEAAGLSVVGFPCNQFANQEPGSDATIQDFCTSRYDVSFPVFGRIEVNGAGTHPFYAYLKAEKRGLLGSGAIKWNFTKFLVDRAGAVRERFAPSTTPDRIRPAIERLLAEATLPPAG